VTAAIVEEEVTAIVIEEIAETDMTAEAILAITIIEMMIDIETETETEIDIEKEKEIEIEISIETETLIEAEVTVAIEPEAAHPEVMTEEIEIRLQEPNIEVPYLDKISHILNKGYQIIIKNIPWSVSWQQLKDAFREYGPISRADVPQDETVFLQFQRFFFTP